MRMRMRIYELMDKYKNWVGIKEEVIKEIIKCLEEYGVDLTIEIESRRETESGDPVDIYNPFSPSMFGEEEIIREYVIIKLPYYLSRKDGYDLLGKTKEERI